MTDPALFAEANSLIRNEQYDLAVEKLMAGIADLPLACHAKAYKLAGLAFYFSQRWAEALSMFTIAAKDSEVPEDWFNLAMAQARIGDTAGAKASWQRVFDLSYAHQDAPETSTFFQKKLMLAQLMLELGAADELGLDLLERQLMGFYTHERVTDPQFWISRGVPAFSEVMDATREYYRAMHKSEAEWSAFCDRVAAAVDEEGKVYCEEMKPGYRAG